MYVKNEYGNMFGEEIRGILLWYVSGNMEEIKYVVISETDGQLEEPTKVELRQIIMELKNNKNPRENEITAEDIKFVGEDLICKINELVAYWQYRQKKSCQGVWGRQLYQF